MTSVTVSSKRRRRTAGLLGGVEGLAATSTPPVIVGSILHRQMKPVSRRDVKKVFAFASAVRVHEDNARSYTDTSAADFINRLLRKPLKTPSEDSPFRFSRNLKGEETVECEEAKMEVSRPYPYRLSGVWFVAVRHSESDGDVGIYHLSRDHAKDIHSD